ncbi:MAG: PEGA domain-containing protein [Polyangiaceae bacterium]|jgi:hypothetical protein|nr:PEGA domain-containing protein [Polyangiaceae bacterium]
MHDRNHVRPACRFVTAVLCGLLATSAVTPYALAQGAPAAPAEKKMTDKQKREAARNAYSTGSDKLDAKDYEAALPLFQRANELIPSAQALEKVAVCYDGMNKIPDAIAAYEIFIEQAKDKPKLAGSVEAARARIEALKKAPVPVNITSDPPSASIEVDGEPQMGATPLDVKLTPGTHKIKVSSPGYEPVEREVEVKPGESIPDLAFALTKAAEPPPPPVLEPPPAPAVAAPVGHEEPVVRSNVPAYVTLGVAGAAAVVGTIFGITALSDKSNFNDKPTVENADDAERDALVADMAFGVAITLGVTGTVLLLSNKPAQTEQASARPHGDSSVRFAPFVGPTGGGAAASWRF